MAALDFVHRRLRLRAGSESNGQCVETGIQAAESVDFVVFLAIFATGLPTAVP
jgi:hypothetical protein